MLRAGGLVSPMLRELAQVSYQWTGPWVSDHELFDATFGPLPVTPMSEAVAATVSWCQRRSGGGPG